MKLSDRLRELGHELPEGSPLVQRIDAYADAVQAMETVMHEATEELTRYVPLAARLRLCVEKLNRAILEIAVGAKNE